MENIIIQTRNKRDFRKTLKYYLKNLKNCKIIIDFSDEYTCWLPVSFTKKLIKQLKKNNNQIYFCFGSSELDKYINNEFNFHRPDDNIFVVLWPTFWFNKTIFKNTKLCKNFLSKDFSKHNIEYPYICMNNVGRYHRCLMIDLLAKEGLLNNGAVSWRKFQVEKRYQWKYTKLEKKRLSDFRKYNKNTYQGQYIPPSEFYESFMSIVTETLTDIIFITEKTATVVLYKQPFLVQGAMGFHNYLKDLGFKLYTEIFDYSFDLEPDLHKRTEMIIENVKLITNQDLYKLYLMIESKLDFNQNRMIEISHDTSLIPRLILDTKTDLYFP